MHNYKYPYNISDDAYKHRKVTISIKKKLIDATSILSKFKATGDNHKSADRVKKAVTTMKDMEAKLSAGKKSSFDKTVETITLPLPNSFTDSQDHSWSTESGIIGTIGTNLMNTSVGDVAKKMGGGGFAAKAINAISGAASTITADKALGSLSSGAGMRKPLIDPGYFQNYSGSQPRAFAAQWDMVPNNAEEAAVIMMIIMKLKEYSAPTSTLDGVSLLAPYYLNFEMSNKYLSSLIHMDRVVITNLTVDYGADGAMQQTADGMPKHISLSLAMQEVDMVTAERYNSEPALPQKGVY